VQASFDVPAVGGEVDELEGGRRVGIDGPYRPAGPILEAVRSIGWRSATARSAARSAGTSTSPSMRTVGSW
jgi:hypothetical protein